jgi:hypothetical protein
VVLLVTFSAEGGEVVLVEAFAAFIGRYYVVRYRCWSPALA